MQPRFYLDNNIWERFTLPENAAQKDIFVRLAQNKIIKPLLSDTNFIELCGNYKTDSTIPIGYRMATLMMQVIHDSPKIMKSAHMLLVEDGNLPPKKRHSLVKYLDRGKSLFYSSMKVALRAGLGYSDSLARIRERYDEHAKLRESFREDSKRFLELVKSKYTRDEMHIVKKEVTSTPEQFLSGLEKRGWIQEVAKTGARNLGVKRKIPTHLSLGAMGLLGVFTRVWCYLLFNQIKNDMLPKSSDLDDMFHCLLAGVVGNIVSDEKPHKLPGMTRFAWQGNRNVKCYSFEIFNEYLLELEGRAALTHSIQPMSRSL